MKPRTEPSATSTATIDALNERIRDLFEPGGQFSDVIIGERNAGEINNLLSDTKTDFTIHSNLMQYLAEKKIRVVRVEDKKKDASKRLEELSKFIYAQAQYTRIVNAFPENENSKYLRELLKLNKAALLERLKNEIDIRSVPTYIETIENFIKAKDKEKLAKYFDNIILRKKALRPNPETLNRSNQDRQDRRPSIPLKRPVEEVTKKRPAERPIDPENIRVTSRPAVSEQDQLITDIKSLFGELGSKTRFEGTTVVNDAWLNSINPNTDNERIRQLVTTAIDKNDLDIPIEDFNDPVKKNKITMDITNAITDVRNRLKPTNSFSFRESPSSSTSTTTTSNTTTTSTAARTSPVDTTPIRKNIILPELPSTPEQRKNPKPLPKISRKANKPSSSTSTSEEAEGREGEGAAGGPIPSPAPKFEEIPEEARKNLATHLHNLNAIMSDNVSLKVLNETLTHDNLRSKFIGPTQKKDKLTELNDFKQLQYLTDESYPLGKKIRALAGNPNSEEAYQEFKKEVQALEKLSSKYTQQSGWLYKSPPEREIAGMIGSAARLIDQIQSSIGSISGAADQQERMKNQAKCREKITLINLMIGQLENQDGPAHKDDIDKLMKKRAQLQKLLEKTLAKENHKKIRTYSPVGSRLVELAGNTTKEKMQDALRQLGMDIPDNPNPNTVPILYSEENRIVKYTKEESGKFRVDPGMDVVIHDRANIHAYYQTLAQDQRPAQCPDQLTLKLSSGVGVIGDKFMGIMNISKYAGLMNAEGDYLIPDEQMLEFAATFVLKFHAALPLADKGKPLVLSEAVHPRAVLAIQTYCKLSVEKFPIPRAPASYLPYINGIPENDQADYRKNMEAHMRTEGFKKRVKQSEEDAATSAKEEKHREQTTLDLDSSQSNRPRT